MLTSACVSRRGLLFAAGPLLIGGLLTARLLTVPRRKMRPRTWFRCWWIDPEYRALPSLDPKEVWVDRLIDSRWQPSAAKAVITLNEQWFRLLQQHAPDQFEGQLARMARLGEVGGLSVFLEENPQFAALFLEVADPVALSNARRPGPIRTCLPGSSSFTPILRKGGELAEAVIQDGEMIARLLRRGIFGAELLFLFSREHPSARDYRSWLQRQLNLRLGGPDEPLASFVHLALRQVAEIRRRMQTDSRFRDDFPSLWDRLVNAIGSHGLEFYLEDAEVWSLLALSDGCELLRRWGPLAVRLLFGNRAYPGKLRDPVIRLLLDGDNYSVGALVSLRGEPAFHHLLARPLARPLMRSVLARLHEVGPDAPNLLQRYREWEDTTFDKEFAPSEPGPVEWLPLYSVYVVAEKLYDGREVTTRDWIEAAVEVGTTFMPMPGAKAGGVITTQLGKKAAAKVSTQQAVRQLQKQGLASRHDLSAARAWRSTWAKKLFAMRLFTGASRICSPKPNAK